MQDKSRSIFGNVMPDKVYNKALRSKKKYIKKFGDDSNVNYNAIVRKNPVIGDSLGVYDIRLEDGQSPEAFDTEKGIIVSNIRMGFGHYRISMAMASAAKALGYTPYWLDLNSFPQTTCTKVISAQNDLYSLGSRWSKNPIFNKLVWEPMNYEGFRALSYNAADQKNAELMAPVYRNIPKDIPVIGTHVWPAQSAIHAGMKHVVNAIPDNWPMALHLSEGSVHTIQCKNAYMGYRILNGMNKEEALNFMFNWLKEHNRGEKRINYKMREWVFARQRYWGEPIPVVHYKDHDELLPESELPLVLPELDDYKPKVNGTAPLENAEEWKKYTNPVTGEVGKRETNTMPGSAASSWYFMRYIDPQNDKEFANQELLAHWMPVDLYVGGPEHAVGHLLYSRFWTHFLHDQGLSPVDEPFKKLVHQGMILGENGEKMSKSRGNVINPDDVVRDYGADTLRLYEMFMGPLIAAKPWSTTGLEGARKFLDRVYRLVTDPVYTAKIVTDYDKELEKIDAKVRELNAHKKDVEMRRENAVKAHVFGDFEKKKIPIEKFLTLSMLSKKELEGILSEAEDLSKKTDKGTNDTDK
jgi:hypothetical protein